MREPNLTDLRFYELNGKLIPDVRSSWLPWTVGDELYLALSIITKHPGKLVFNQFTTDTTQGTWQKMPKIVECYCQGQGPGKTLKEQGIVSGTRFTWIKVEDPSIAGLIPLFTADPSMAYLLPKSKGRKHAMGDDAMGDGGGSLSPKPKARKRALAEGAAQNFSGY